MIPLTFGHQTITVFSKLEPIITLGLSLLIPIIIIESLIMKNYSKRTWWKLFKFCVIINIIASSAAIFFGALFGRSPHVIMVILCWVALLVVIIGAENIIYQKCWQVKHKRKLLLALIIINFIAYFIFTASISLMVSSSVKGEYINRLRCTNNLKQIGIGLIMYADDYKGFLPNKSGYKGFEQLRSNCYRSYDNVYQCPSCNPSPVQPCSVSQAKKQKLTKENVDYIYRSGLKLGDDKKTDYSKIPVVWDKPTNHENYGNVLFLDGHVKGFEGKDWMEQAGIKKTVSQQKK